MPAIASCWSANAVIAHVALPKLSAAINAAEPGLGMHHLTVFEQNCPGLSILGVTTDSLVASGQTLVEWHTREHDQAASYESNQGKAVRLDLVWSVAGESDQGSSNGCVAQFDLTLSARTNVLDWHPDVFAQSELPGGQIYCLADVAAARFAPVESIEAEEPADEQKPSCFWYRPVDAGWSYVEMVHPADVQLSRCIEAAAGEHRSRLSHHLFRPESLERGVILRARLRGLFLPKDIDPATIAQMYAAFVAADPALSIR